LTASLFATIVNSRNSGNLVGVASKSQPKEEQMSVEERNMELMQTLDDAWNA
jgi:hypothetical protein